MYIHLYKLYLYIMCIKCNVVGWGWRPDWSSTWQYVFVCTEGCPSVDQVSVYCWIGGPARGEPGTIPERKRRRFWGDTAGKSTGVMILLASRLDRQESSSVANMVQLVQEKKHFKKRFAILPAQKKASQHCKKRFAVFPSPPGKSLTFFAVNAAILSSHWENFMKNRIKF